jgi:hypothetical protein
VSGWDQQGDIDDLNRRLRRERIEHRAVSIVFLIGALLNIALGIVRQDWIEFAIGVFLLVMYATTRR